MAKKRMNVVWGQRYGDVNDPKTRWHTCGTLFIDEETGRMSIKLDVVPIGKDFNGFLAVMEPRKWEDRNNSTEEAEPAGLKLPEGDSTNGDEPINLDDIPF